ncbi:MAG: bifunctional (p)ppGpp synthetase/guanosine-3',5'-bis(diphosphate) 3'-pyrophosphohydrolase [Planctomycetota bacterium]|nr:MAG: bifunctional (p)ppGpp synthetase/guanosine-3',5'-bis(diphosphate) 3'-pyrophosphohydrolase [Planctomycetota bacterium]
MSSGFGPRLPRRALAVALALCASPCLAQPAGEVERAVAATLAAARARLAPADYARFREAVAFAREAHRGQVRDGGRPFLLHPLAVARALLADPRPVSGVAASAAILHDVVEDTPRTLRELRARFGPRVARLVDYLSLPDPAASGGDKATRDRAYYARFRNAPREAHLVKYHDRLHNIRDMAGWSPEGKLGYLAATRAQVVESLRPRSPDLARALEREVARQEARAARELLSPSERLAPYRRADGTLRWRELLRNGALREGAGLARFALALFLKELAVVLRTGDRARFEEFFEGLANTDFFLRYGLFAAGARVGEVAYARSLARLIKPRFVSSLLRSTVVLAAGLALPEAVAGEFSGEAFALSLASLGLSSAAVHGSLSALRWAAGLRGRSALASLGLRLGRLTGAAGWAYSVAQTAVVLLLADAVAARLAAWRSEAEARSALADAGLRFFAAVQDPDLDPAGLRKALARYDRAWNAWRAWLSAELDAEDARLAAELERLAARAKRAGDVRTALDGRLARFPHLRASLAARHGSAEGFADAAARRSEDEVSNELDALLAEAAVRRAQALAGLYRKLPRARPYLDGAPLAAAGPAPPGSLARLRALLARRRLRAALEDARPTRPGSYADQASALAATARLLAGRPALARTLEEQRRRLAGLRSADRRLGGLVGALPR